MIRIQGLRKSYGAASALDGFSLCIAPGELFGLVGPNGAGKTTLIKILATLLQADQGHARIDGRDVRLVPREVRSVTGYLPDVAGLYQDMRVGEFLEFFADAFHLKGNDRNEAIERALEMAGLSTRRESFVEQLSMGMKQRLVLAKTLLHKPKVLLLDEPATGLDPLARIDLRELLKKLNREGVTIFISSHILSDLEDICSKVALIDHGKNAGNAADGGVLDLARAPSSDISCEIEFAGPAEPAARAAQEVAGARVIESTGSRLRVETEGGASAASALLRHLLGAGLVVTRFDTHGPGLEEQYRKAFGADRQ
jgi:ABC-2 type transport system ATP-binding protein